MTAVWATPVGRARDELRAAQVLLEAGFASQAMSCACGAALHAASAALMSLDETPGTEAGVVSAFGRHVVDQDGVGHEHSRTLRRLFEDRDSVERALLEAPAGEALKAIRAAEDLVDACERLVEKGRSRA